MSSRIDQLLSALLNGETVDITPQSRAEVYLKALIDGAGTEGLPAPLSRMDAYFYALVEKGLGGSSVVFTDFSWFCNLGARVDTLSELDTSKGTTFSNMFRSAKVVTIPKLDTSSGTRFDSMFIQCEELITIPELDTSSGTRFDSMFNYCEKLTTIPKLDTSGGTNFDRMFYYCSALTTIPELDTSSGTSFKDMFYGCSALTTIPELDTSKGTIFKDMFCNCSALTTILELDIRNGTDLTSMFYGCSALTTCLLKNIKMNLQVGSGKSYGHLLTVDSLIHLIYECCDTRSSKTLTIGSVNLEKLADVYIKRIDITDEMRAEDDLVDEKLPFVVCESTDEGAMLITDYPQLKKWILK